MAKKLVEVDIVAEWDDATKEIELKCRRPTRRSLLKEADLIPWDKETVEAEIKAG